MQIFHDHNKSNKFLLKKKSRIIFEILDREPTAVIKVSSSVNIFDARVTEIKLSKLKSNSFNSSSYTG